MNSTIIDANRSRLSLNLKELLSYRDLMFTLAYLGSLKHPGIRIIHKPNGGPASARNRGIAEAGSSYILTLDSDNKIEPTFTDQAIHLLDTDDSIHMVYGDRMMFGDENYLKVVGPPDLARQFLGNTSDTFAIFRKSMWDALGGLGILNTGTDCRLPASLPSRSVLLVPSSCRFAGLDE